MDASEFKEYIFGALFLKRSSDVFEVEREKVIANQIEQGRSQADAERRADDPDFYKDAFFVPPEARWAELRDNLHHQVGNGLNKALAALENENPALEGVLQHIDFSRRVGTTTMSDKKWRDLLDHFSKHRLRNDDFEFPDLLGAAYEYLIRDFADSAGKKGGEFYTPRQVVQLMVRIVNPTEGMSVYDPCCGSGGMLIYARNHVADNGGNASNLSLAGQENNGTTWSIAKMNMLLHGIRDADLRNNDTLSDPEHVRDGELTRFDRVITNPPFSQNYDKAELKHTERFRYGYTPEGGKKADLMFLQHMVAVLKKDGVLATVMPHGVLFRGGEEGKIRQQMIEDDLVDTIIGLGPNLFYGTGIPAAVLILRAKGSKPPERQGKVLFINADLEFSEGRAQNFVGPQHEHKIVETYNSFSDVDGFAKVISLGELGENDFNCNIRRYADNAPPPEPHDVRAHLHGGVPVSELEAGAALLSRAGVDRSSLFTDRGDGYADWVHEPQVNEQHDRAKGLVSDGVATASLDSVIEQWWKTEAEPSLRSLTDDGSTVGMRAKLVESFAERLVPARVDRFESAGMVASWWEECVFDLQTASTRGWSGVLESWLTSAEANQENKNAPNLADEAIIRILASEALGNRAELAKRAVQLDAESKSALVTEDELEVEETPVTPAELKSLKSELKRVKKDLKSIDSSLLDSAKTTMTSLNRVQAMDLALCDLRRRLDAHVEDYAAATERETLAWYENLASKYGTTLRQLEAARDDAALRLNAHLEELGYE